MRSQGAEKEKASAEPGRISGSAVSSFRSSKNAYQIGSARDRPRWALDRGNYRAVRNNDPAEAGGIDIANDPDRLVNATAEDEGTAGTDGYVALDVGAD